MVTKIDMLRDDNEGEPVPSVRTSGSSAGQALAKLRLRWPWLALTAILGIVLAYAVTSSGAVYQSTASVRLSDAGTDSTRVQQIAQTVTNTVLSSNVVREAAKRTGVSESDLSARLSALWKSDTDIVEITVRGTDAEAVPRQTSAVVTSLLDYYDSQRASQISQLRQVGDELLDKGSLANSQAENARRSGIGSAIAEQQGTAASAGTSVTPLDPATTAQRASLSSPVAGGIGALLGVALGAVLALAVPFRRRRIRRASNATALIDGVRASDASDVAVAEAAGRFLESERSDLVVVSSGKAAKEAHDWAARVHAVLRAHGASVALVEEDAREPELTPAARPRHVSDPDERFSGFLALGRAGRVARREDLGVDSLIIVAPDDPQVLSMLAGQTEVSSVVIVRADRTRLAGLQRVCEALRWSDPTVIVVR